jgi:hypothetical protein
MWKAKKKVPDIMLATGACYTSVYSIWRKYQAEGKKSIAVRPRGDKLGEGRHLTPEQELRIQKQIIDKHPDQPKLDFAFFPTQYITTFRIPSCEFVPVLRIAVIKRHTESCHPVESR